MRRFAERGKTVAHPARLGSAAEKEVFMLVMNAVILRFARNLDHSMRGFIMIPP